MASTTRCAGANQCFTKRNTVLATTQTLASRGATPQPSVLRGTIENFYQTDAISRASQVMAKCVQERQRADAQGVIRGLSTWDGSGAGSA